ncbi:MAG: hypothetical protein ACON4T_02760, partial [Synechococcus sp.]
MAAGNQALMSTTMKVSLTSTLMMIRSSVTPLTPVVNADLYLQNNLYALKGSSDSDAVVLTNSRGKTYSDATTANWDAVSALKQVDGTFRVLLDGTGSRENQALVWTTNGQGV